MSSEPSQEVPVAVLDELLTLASRGLVAARFTAALAAPHTGEAGQAQGQAAIDALLKMCQRLEALGAQDREPLSPPAPRDPLSELARVERSRSEALQLLDALRRAHELGEALDAKRGDGDEWGERLFQAVCSLELELYGPGERVTGARE